MLLFCLDRFFLAPYHIPCHFSIPSLYLRLVVKAQHRIVILTEQSRHIVISSRPPPPPPSSSLPRESQHFFIVLCPAFYRENEEGDGNDMILYIISPPEG